MFSSQMLPVPKSTGLVNSRRSVAPSGCGRGPV
jgi:hypothetical protein